MTYEILSKQAYHEYEQFVQSHPNGHFMQSVNWVTVKREWQQTVVVVRRGGDIVGGFAALRRSVGPVSMLYAPRGPVCDYHDGEVVAELCRAAVALTKKHLATEFIFDPYVDPSDSVAIENFKRGGCSLQPNAGVDDTVQPRYNYVVDIKGHTPDTLLAAFNRDTRYYVKASAKRGVRCEVVGVDKLDDFYNLYNKTGSRKGFGTRQKDYFLRIREAFGDKTRMYVAYDEEQEPLCGAVAIQYGNRTSHVYGGSSDNKRKLFATYAAQWAMMGWAMDGGSALYDMMGIAPTEEYSPALYGVYRFKQQFTGRVVQTVGEFTCGGNTLVRAAAGVYKKVRG